MYVAWPDLVRSEADVCLKTGRYLMLDHVRRVRMEKLGLIRA